MSNRMTDQKYSKPTQPQGEGLFVMVVELVGEKNKKKQGLLRERERVRVVLKKRWVPDVVEFHKPIKIHLAW